MQELTNKKLEAIRKSPIGGTSIEETIFTKVMQRANALRVPFSVVRDAFCAAFHIENIASLERFSTLDAILWLNAYKKGA